jgi:hypothetical protein
MRLGLVVTRERILHLERHATRTPTPAPHATHTRVPHHTSRASNTPSNTRARANHPREIKSTSNEPRSIDSRRRVAIHARARSSSSSSRSTNTRAHTSRYMRAYVCRHDAFDLHPARGALCGRDGARASRARRRTVDCRRGPRPRSGSPIDRSTDRSTDRDQAKAPLCQIDDARAPSRGDFDFEIGAVQTKRKYTHASSKNPPRRRRSPPPTTTIDGSFVFVARIASMRRLDDRARAQRIYR